MRVTGGELAGRRLGPVPRGVRPTSDRVRESLFAWLGGWLRGDPGGGPGGWAGWEGALVLDLYAGTGALGIEALSRGAGAVTFVERAPAALRALTGNLDALDLSERSEVRRGAALRVLRRGAPRQSPYALVFVDPPYESEELAHALPLLAAGGWISPRGVVVVERSRRLALPEVAGLRVVESRRYGDTIVDALCQVPVE